ncbi:MAG: Integral membrane protein MviN [Microgenomates group bacterium GW2011_GWC2_45_8]|nr:MAG: Integral membrane protein MviN [Microgenomates group bacterium GW2011_GWC2_45_8]
MAVSICARSLTHVLVRVFYALHNTVTPFVVNLASTITNIGLSYYFLFVIKSGVLGMAVAISVASLIETVVLTSLLYNLTNFSAGNLLRPFSKMLGITLITSLSLWVPLRVLDNLIFDTTRTISLILLTLTVGLIGLLVYIFLSYLFNITELGVFARLARKIGGWHKALSQSGETLETSETPV